jgi:HAD superfamily hydrolase (TIGR01509 family)
VPDLLAALTQAPGVIFDLDGTLADSVQVWDGVCAEWLAAQGVPVPVGLEGELVMLTARQAAALVVGRFGLAATPLEAATAFEQVVARRYRDTVALKPGAAALVAALARQGKKLALATSSFPAAVEGLLSRTGLRRHFTALAYTDEVPRSKAHPDLYLLAAQRLAVSPPSCLVFEDRPETLSGVHAAGMRLVAVQDGACPDWPAFAAAADFAVTDLREALA